MSSTNDDQQGNRRDSLAFEKAYELAVRIVNAYKYLCEAKNEYVLSRQLLRSGTAIASNLMGLSDADFSARVSIAYKEAQETKYWLSLMKDTGFIGEKSYASIHADVDEVAAILFDILNKKPTGKKKRSKPKNGPPPDNSNTREKKSTEGENSQSESSPPPKDPET